MKLPDSFPVTVKCRNSVVKIYRHQNGQYQEFKLAYYASGKRKFETFSDYERAKTRADEINDSVTNGNLDGIALSKEECILFRRATEALDGSEIDVAAREYAEARKLLGKTPLLDAVRDYIKRHPSSLKKKTVQEVYSELLNAKKIDGASGVYLKDLSIRLGRFSAAFNCNVNDLTADEINEFLRSLETRGRSETMRGRSRNNYRRAIGTFIKFAEIKNAIPKGQIALTEVARANEESFRVDIFSRQDMLKLLKAAQISPENLKPGFNKRYANGQGLLPLLVLSAFAGMRTSGEIRRQKWSDINLETGFIRVTAAKRGTAADRLIPIQDNLRNWLALCPKSADTCCTYARPEDAIERLAKRAGIEWRHNALRHSYGSYRTAQTRNVPQVALEMGNSPKMIMKHYREVVTQADGDAWFKINPGMPANVVPMPSSSNETKEMESAVRQDPAKDARRLLRVK